MSEIVQPGGSAEKSWTVALVHNTSRYLSRHYGDLLGAFLEQGWSVVCIAPRDHYTSRLEIPGVRFVDLKLARQGLNPISELASLAALYRIYRRNPPDVVLNFSIKPAIYSSLAARAAGVKSINSVITGLGYVFMDEKRAGKLKAGLAGLCYRKALGSNRCVFFQNADDRDFFVNRGMAEPYQCRVTPGSGVDTEYYSPAVPKDLEMEGNFVMVARLLYHKGVREYAEACRLIRRRHGHIRCALLGPYDDNPAAIDPDEVNTWVREGILEYLGESDDVRDAIRRYQVFVLPSYREGLSRSILEAMAMGMPVVTTDVPGCRETVEHGVNGYLVPPGNAAALAEAMERFVLEPDDIERMGLASRKAAVQSFDVKSINRDLILALREGALG